MDVPYLGEIRLLAGPIVPAGWALCNGQELQISQYQGIFSVLGTSYGGNGYSTFCLPYMGGRIGQHVGGGSVVGVVNAGEAGHVLTIGEMPGHGHGSPPCASTAGNKTNPLNGVPAATGSTNIYSQNAHGAQTVAMSDKAVSTVGTGQAHENMMPYAAVNWIIAMQGTYPS